MADVFISYKREDQSAAAAIAAALRQLNLDIWFDQELRSGESFSADIDREVRQSRVVLVCWSPAAARSDWVKSEALVGFDANKLVAAYVQGPNGFEAPVPFNIAHYEDLRSWLKQPASPDEAWNRLLSRIAQLTNRHDVRQLDMKRRSPEPAAERLHNAYLSEIRHAYEFATFDLHGRRVGDDANGVPYLPLRIGRVQAANPVKPEHFASEPRPETSPFGRIDEVGRERVLREAPAELLLRTPGRRLLVGSAGSGKSTFVRWLAQREARENGRTALLVDISSWVRSGKPFVEYWAEQWLPSLRAQILSSARETLELPQLAEAALEWLRGGTAYVVLDGLDEVSEQHFREGGGAALRLWRSWLSRPVEAETTVLATSRPGGWLSLADVEEEYHLLPLRPQDTQLYLLRFFQWRRSEDEARAVAAQLEEALRRDSVMRRLAENPFFLELSAFVFEKRGFDLPTELPIVFEYAIQALLEQPPQRSAAPLLAEVGLDELSARAVLERIAWCSFERGERRQIGRTTLLRLLQEAASALGMSLDAHAVLNAFLGRRLLSERGDSYEFLHLSVQEFLAARHLTDPTANLDLASLVDEMCWRKEWELLMQFVAASFGPLSGGADRQTPEALQRLVTRLVDGGRDDIHGRRAFVAAACLRFAPREGPWRSVWKASFAKTEKAILSRLARSRNIDLSPHTHAVLFLIAHPQLQEWLDLGREPTGEISRALQGIARDERWEYLQTSVLKLEDYSGWGDPDQKALYLERYFKGCEQLWFLGDAARALLGGVEQASPVSNSREANREDEVPTTASACIEVLRTSRSAEGLRAAAARRLATMPRDEGLALALDLIGRDSESEHLRADLIEAFHGSRDAQLLKVLEGAIQLPGDMDFLRDAAARGLHASGDPGAIAFLSQALDSQSWDVRRPAAMALSRSPPPELHAKLANLIFFDHRSMEHNSAHSLSVLRLGRAYARPFPMLADRDLTRFKMGLAWGLAGTSDTVALRVLRQALGAGNTELRLAAADALRKSLQRRDLFEKMVEGAYGPPLDLGDAVESLAVPFWPNFIVWPDGTTSSSEGG